MYKKIISFAVVIVSLFVLTIYSMTTGSIAITVGELLTGLFTGTNENVEIIKDLRLPRVVIALFAGATLSVSGVLLQAVMRNPLAEPGIIGISSGAGFMSIMMITFFPTLFFYTPLFSFIGGAVAFLFVYLFSWKSGLNPLRMILIGVAINAVFTGLSELMAARNASSMMSGISVSSSTLTMKTWDDVQVIALYGTIGLILSFLVYAWCNHLSLRDQTLKNLGFRVNRARFIISIIAVLLASIATAIAGMFTFVGLLIPHIGRSLVGNDHKLLIPFSAIAGALLILSADTLGRTLLSPIEIPASIIMAVIGGPFLIFLLRKSDRIYGN
ncbi:FecCD family ABC transporter permease [Sporosarcina ureilytica]|uniref:Probable heme-iron transport system permease protein IsdF n=1 Tax=Sporosarcina ureilytica TaxID=298596 RepID=A0A1D8JE28_9BACL|nr:iron ABC transporter permease [Sporosarcina ureilytica]AOV06948.1 ABC transporter permease [Sporosarcina ureilytica]